MAFFWPALCSCALCSGTAAFAVYVTVQPFLLLSHAVAEPPETKEYNVMKEKVCLTTDATFEDFLDVLPTALEAVSLRQGMLEGC